MLVIPIAPVYLFETFSSINIIIIIWCKHAADLLSVVCRVTTITFPIKIKSLIIVIIVIVKSGVLNFSVAKDYLVFVNKILKWRYPIILKFSDTGWMEHGSSFVDEFVAEYDLLFQSINL